MLDTNVFRRLAHGELRAYLEELRTLAAHRNPPILWTSYLAFQEIAAHINEAEAVSFEQHRDALRFMDELCCNHGMARTSAAEILRRTLVKNAAPIISADNVKKLNVFRRRVIKAESYAALSPEERELCLKIHEASGRERNDWVALGDKLAEQIIELGKAERVEPPFAAFEETVVRGFIEHYYEVSANLGHQRDPETVRNDLREHLYLHAFLVWKAITKDGYNYRKHATDKHDLALLVFAADGYTIVTCDNRLIRNLGETSCPNPRIVDIEDALAMV